MQQISRVPSLRFACTFSPFEGGEAGPLNFYFSRWSALYISVLCFVFVPAPFGVVCGQEHAANSGWRVAIRAAETGDYEVAWRMGFGAVFGGGAETTFYGNVLSGGKGRVGGLSSVTVAPRRSVLVGLDATRFRVGHLLLGVKWKESGAVLLHVPIVQPAAMPLPIRWRAFRWVDLGRETVGKAIVDWSPGARPVLVLSSAGPIWQMGAGSSGAWAGWSSQRANERLDWTVFLGCLRGGLVWVGVVWGQCKGWPWLSRYAPGFMPSP